MAHPKPRRRHDSGHDGRDDSDRTCDVAQVLLAPGRCILADPMVLFAGCSAPNGEGSEAKLSQMTWVHSYMEAISPMLR